MRMLRQTVSGLASVLVCAVHVSAQTPPTGTITGRVMEGATQRPIQAVSVSIDGTTLSTLTATDGSFALRNVPAGLRRVTASSIGYAPLQQEVTVVAGETVNLAFTMAAEAIALQALVVTGYGTQRRVAITGSVATLDADQANVGVVTDANQLIQGRVAGVHMTQNNGEPGAAAQVRIRGGTSLSASNEPLYVIDGVPITNAATEAAGIGIGGGAPLQRSPLNLLNPSDIESITILKDAAAAAIYGSRAANGVVLIETKKAAVGGLSVEYDGYVAAASAARRLDVLDGDQYRSFIQQQVQLGNLSQERLTALGEANTNWESEITRTGVTHNHNISFSGGTPSTRYRASLNYMNQEGVVLSSGLERLQGRLNGTQQIFNDRLRLSLNLTSSQVKNDYVPIENTGGFEGGVLQNVAIFNPTQPVTVAGPGGETLFYELGAGRQSVRNPVAIAEQVDDVASTTRTLGNAQAELDLIPGLTGRVNVGVDHAGDVRQIYLPRNSAVGAEWNGRGAQRERQNSAVTLQTLLTARPRIADIHDVEVIGGYEYNDYTLQEFWAESRNFLTDAFGFNNLGGGSELIRPFSLRQDSRLVSFFGRANYSYQDRYFLTGVLRRDGSSRFGAGNKWATFPAVSAAWRLSEESFLKGRFFSDLRLRAGYGLQGNEAVPPYASLILLEPRTDASYPFGESPVTGVSPVSNPNPNLKWEQTAQVNVGIDYGFLNNRFAGSIEYYVKNTKDLLLVVGVPSPAVAANRLENIGKVRNKGLEASLDARVIDRPALSWQAGLVFAAERNTVVDLGGQTFIRTGVVSGQGQSGQRAQRIIPGEPLGTFFGPEFVGVNDQGKQEFNKYEVERDAQGRVIRRELVGTTTDPGGDDFVVLGDANPDFTFGLRSQGSWRNFDFNLLARWEQGGKVFNNTALVYSTKGNALQDKNFLASALDDPTGIREPAIFSSRWIEDRSFLRMQNITIGYTFNLPGDQARTARIFVSGDNLFLVTGYSGLDPEVFVDGSVDAGVPGVRYPSRGIDYLVYPRPRTITTGIHFAF